VGDDITGADPGNVEHIYPYTGGSRFIQAGLLSRAQMTASHSVWLLSRCCWRVARGVARSGCDLARVRGLGLGLLYSLPGVQLSARGLGEPPWRSVSCAAGARTVWLQTGFVDSTAVLLCLPVSAWAAAILIINEVPDIEADAARTNARSSCVGRRRRAVDLSRACRDRPGGLGAIIGRHALPLWYALPAVIFAGLGLHAVRGISTESRARPRLKRSIELSLAIHALGCVTLISAILLNHVI